MPCWTGCELPCLPWEGLALIGVGHLSTRLVSAVATDSIFEKLISFLGKSLGIGALLIAAIFMAAGLGLWLLKNWGRSLTLALVGVWLLFGVVGLLRHAGPFHLVKGGRRRRSRGSSREMKDFRCSPYYRKRLCRVCR